MIFQHKFYSIQKHQNLAFAVLIEELFSEESHKIEKKNYEVQDHIL